MKPNKQLRNNPTFLAYAVAVLIPMLALAFALIKLSPTRVGDGAEYYAMYFALKFTLRPFMSPVSWAHYDALVNSNAISSMVSLKRLLDQFPALRLGDTADLNHFWMYSAFAAGLSALVSAAGITLSPHTAFLLAHAVMFAAVSMIAFRLAGWKGLGGVVLMTVLSPMIWFMDKVHTEFFTYCFVLGGVIAFSGSQFIAAALLLAIASTQNISFAAIAFTPLLVDIFRRKHRSYSMFELIALAFTALAVFAHPTYYFFRYGVADPQLLAGGAKVGTNLKLAYIWLFDPDVGLLPNWPLGIVVVVYGFIARKRLVADKQWAQNYAFFCVCYLVVNLAAQSSTENLNSGATPGLARYATWYIPLFYPLTVEFFCAIKRAKRIWRVASLLIVALCLFFTIKYERPELSEAGYVSPSPVSRLIQTHLPYVYNPPEEIFSERYGGIGETPPLLQAYAVVGPDCKKVLMMGGPGPVYGGSGCGFSQDKLKGVVESAASKTALLHPGDYLHLSPAQAAQAVFECPRHLDFSDAGNVPNGVLSGFDHAETWGRWSDDVKASLKCSPPKASAIRIQATSFSPNGHKQSVSIAIDDSPPKNFVLEGGLRVLDIEMPAQSGKQITVKFRIPDALSPHSLGFSVDNRNLGIGVRTIDFLP